MKIGRNDPCACGSGKKYKKCCLQKDEVEARHEHSPASHSEKAEAAPKFDRPEPRTPPPPDPHLEAIDARYEEFNGQDYEGQVALFLQTLDEEGLMDDEMAFEMLNTLYDKTVEHGERDRFDGLIDRLRERLPDVYAREAHFCLEWRMANALAAGRGDALPVLVNEMAALPPEQVIDNLDRVLDQVAYHGHLSVLVGAMRIAWPQVRDSEEIVPWGIDEFSTRAVDYEIFDYLERHPSADPSDPELSRRIASYCEVDPERLDRYLAHLTGRTQSIWTMSDFELEAPRSESRQPFDDWEDETDRKDEDQPLDTGRQNLVHLSLEFLGYLRRAEDVPYTKGELGRQQIRQYILDRLAGKLEPRESTLEKAMRPQRREPKPKPPKPEHELCPDRGTLDRFMAQLLHFLNPQYYKVAALFELIPAWLRFLESRRLIDAEQRAKTLLELRGLDTHVLKILERLPEHPILPLAVKRWREDAERKTLP